MIFLCIWSWHCSISDNALDILISFIYAVFKALGTIFPSLTAFALIFPKSLNLLKNRLCINRDNFTKYVVCPKCESLYKFSECHREQFGRTVINNCQYISQENHRQIFRRTPCGQPKEVTLKNGKKRLYPLKVYCYKSVIDNLKRLVNKPMFRANCELCSVI